MAAKGLGNDAPMNPLFGLKDVKIKKNTPASDITGDSKSAKESDNASAVISDNSSDIISDNEYAIANDNASAKKSDIDSDINSDMFKPKKQPKYVDAHERRTHYILKENVKFIDDLYERYNQDKSETVNKALLLYKEYLKNQNKKNKK